MFFSSSGLARMFSSSGFAPRGLGKVFPFLFVWLGSVFFFVSPGSVGLGEGQKNMLFSSSGLARFLFFVWRGSARLGGVVFSSSSGLARFCSSSSFGLRGWVFFVWFGTVGFRV